MTTPNSDRLRTRLPLQLDSSIQAREVWNLDLATCRRESEMVMSIPDQILDDWNPPTACFQTVGCPNCDLAARNRAYNFTWSPHDPDRTTCKHCGEVYPSDKHPLDRVTDVVSPSGTRQCYPYTLGDDGWRYYMNSQMHNLRRFWMRQQAVLLSHLSSQTGEVDYAFKAGATIRRFAQIYPDIPIHGVTSTQDPNPAFYDQVEIVPAPPSGVQPVPEHLDSAAFRSYDAPYPWQSTRAGLWNRWVYDEIPLSLILAYGQVAEALDAVDRETIEDYFRQVINYVRTYPRYLTNYEPLLAKGEIACGRIIGEPEFVHGGIQRLNLMIRHRYYPDGAWCEGSPLYSAAVYDFLLSALKAAVGHSDPPGYRGTEDGETFEDFDPQTMTDMGTLRLALEAMQAPDGNFAAVADTFGGAFRAREHPKDYFPVLPLDASEPGLLWACGHAVLGFGSGTNQIQARLQYMGQAGHHHLDRLGIEIYAHGREMVSDIGYAQNNLRAYATSSFAHNLVLVDEQSQSIGRGFAPADEVLSFHAGHPIVQFVSVGSTQAYPNSSLYRRSLAFVRVSDSDAYLVDLFEVNGGSQHDWLLHGDADIDNDLTLGVETRSLEESPFRRATPFQMWPSENASPGVCHPDNLPNALGLLRNARVASPAAGLSATLAPRPTDGSALRLHLPHASEADLIVGEIPSIRQAGTRNDELLDYWMPLIIARRSGRDLESAFLAVHEPYRGGPFLDSVEWLDGALVVRHGDVTDLHLFGTGTDESRLEGRYGFLRLTETGVDHALLVDGSRLAHGSCDLRLPDASRGTVMDVRNRSLTLSEELLGDCPERIHLSFSTGMTTCPPVKTIERRGKSVLVVLESDPGFTIADNGGEFTAFPGGRFEGQVRYRIPRHTGF